MISIHNACDDFDRLRDFFHDFTSDFKDVLWIATPHLDRILFVNQAYEQVWRRPIRNLQANSYDWAEAIHPEDRARTKAHFREAHASIADAEYRIVTPEGTTRWIHDRSFPIRDAQGRTRFVAGIATDITRKREAMCATNMALDRFAAIASHDLQEPLRTITSYLKLIEERSKEALDPTTREFMRFALDAAQRMKALIQDLLASAKTGHSTAASRAVPLEAALNRALKDLEGGIAESGARIVKLVPLPEVNGDVGELTRLLENLIGNAIKYRSEEPPLVRVEASERERDWLISISDNGIGVPPDAEERIFEAFERLHTRSEYAGTGLGLFICRRIVARHGGRIWVEPNPEGQGSSFRFTLSKEAQAARLPS